MEIGFEHKCVVTPDSKIYVIGGQQKQTQNTSGSATKNAYLI